MNQQLRSTIHLLRFVTLSGLTLLATGSLPPLSAQPTDTIYFGGDIITMKGPTPETVEALAIRDGRITFAGSLAEASASVNSETKRINLKGKTLLPGFIDGHSHLLAHADGYTQAVLSPPPMGAVNSIADIVRQLQNFKKQQKLADNQWLVGAGYDQNFLREKRHPTARDLDRSFPNNPVVLLHASGHMLVANSRAFEVVGINASTPDPAGGTIIRRAGSREPEGLVQEMAMAPFTEFASPARDLETDLTLIKRAVEHYASYGITTAAEHLVMPQKMAVIEQAAEHGLFRIDLVATPVFILAEKLLNDANFQWRKYHRGLKYIGIKVAVDGSPQGKTAYLSKPYLTHAEGSGEENRGFPNISQKELDSLFSLAYKNKVQLYVHCNGDAAIDMAIEAHKRALSDLDDPNYDHRTVIVHSQIMRPEQLAAYKELNLYPTFFTNHVYYWGEIHRANLGEERASFISPLQSARRRGIISSNHTDNTVTPVDPMFLLWTSVNRRTRANAVLGAAERVTPYEGLLALTADAAYEYFEEKDKGTLEPGKLADLVVLSANPLKVPPMAIKDIRILETIKSGEVVYARR